MHSVHIDLGWAVSGDNVPSRLRGRTFRARTNYPFRMAAGQVIHLEIVVWENGDNCTPIELRPAIRFLQADVTKPATGS
jgi:hypothetical protein